MSLSKISIRELLTFSILIFSLFLFTQNSNALVTRTVNDCGGGSTPANCSDADPLTLCTIRGAADDASDEGDDVHIIIDPSLMCTIALDNDTQINLRDETMGGINNLTIFGNPNVTITEADNTGTFPLVRVQGFAKTWASVTMEDMVFADHDRTNAGGTAIDNSGSGPVTCERCTFSGLTNSDGGLGGGGGILARGTGDLIVIDSLFDGNDCTGSGCGISLMGDGNLTCTTTTFDNNNVFEESGGAILFSPTNPDSVFTSNGCIFINNHADEGDGSGGALEIANGSANISGGNFTDNTVRKNGGAVCITGGDTGDVNFTGVTLNMNYACLGDCTVGGDDANGGALYVDGSYTSTLTLSACNIGDNKAEFNGGAVCMTTVDGTLVIESGTVIDGNVAHFGEGGGVNTNGETVIDNSVISDNKALNTNDTVGGCCGGIRFGDTSGVVSYIRNGSEISGNEVGTEGMSEGTAGGFGLPDSGTEVHVYDSSILFNKAITDGPRGAGGGFATETDTILVIKNSLCEGNVAYTLGGCGFNRGELSVNPTLIIGNTAMEEGGGLYNAIAGEATLDCTTFSMNTSESHGAGIRNFGKLNITSGLFYGNSAGPGGFLDGFGGAISNIGGDAEANILNTTFVENVSNVSGGAISNSDGANANVSFCTFKDNVAPAGSTFFDLCDGGFGCGDAGDITLINSVLQAELANNCAVIFADPPVDEGGNWSTDDSCGFGVNSSEGDDPELGVLAFYGGCIDTCPPIDTSPLKDRIPGFPPDDHPEDVFGNEVTTDAIGLPRPPIGVTNSTIGAREIGGTAATLTVAKVTVPDTDPTDFSFTVTGPGLPTGGCTLDSFMLSNGESNTCNQLAEGTYTITEIPNPAFTTAIACDSGETSLTGSVMVTLEPDEVVTCTVVNGIPVDLTVAVSGECTVSSDIGAIAGCGPGPVGVCMDTYLFGTGVTLTATDTVPGQTYLWSGVCGGTAMTSPTGPLTADSACGLTCTPTGDDDDDDDNNDDNDDNDDNNDDNNDDFPGDLCGLEGTLAFICQQLIEIADGVTETVVSTINNLNPGPLVKELEDLTIQQNLSVLSIFISADEGLEIKNAFLEPDIGNCVEVSDGGPFPLNDETIQFTCTITNFNMGSSVDLVVDVFASGIATTDDDINRFVLYRLDAPELTEPLIVLQGFRVVDDDTGCTLAAAGTRNLGSLAVFALIPGLVLLRIFTRRLRRKK